MTLEEAKDEIIRLVQEHDGDEKEARTAYFACLYLLDQVKEEPVGNPDILTLTELAHELRRIFKFRYLVVERPLHSSYFSMWNQKPRWNGKYWDAENDGEKHIVADFLEFEIIGKVDLSEYADADGNIDYSKCIVEVE